MMSLENFAHTLVCVWMGVCVHMYVLVYLVVLPTGSDNFRGFIFLLCFVDSIVRVVQNYAIWSTEGLECIYLNIFFKL